MGSYTCKTIRVGDVDLLIEFAPNDFFLAPGPVIRIQPDGISLCFLWWTVGVIW